MRHYECVCSQCGIRRQLAFHTEPFPEIGDFFQFACAFCAVPWMGSLEQVIWLRGVSAVFIVEKVKNIRYNYK